MYKLAHEGMKHFTELKNTYKLSKSNKVPMNVKKELVLLKNKS